MIGDMSSLVGGGLGRLARAEEHMRGLKLVLVAIVCVVALVGLCGGIGALVRADPRAYSWSLVDIRRTDSDKSLMPLQSSELPFRYGSLEFTPTDIRGKAACNTFSGVYQLNPATHAFDADVLGFTQRYCGGRVGTFREGTFIAKLRTANRYEVIGGELRLYTDADKTVLIFRRDVPALSLDQLTRRLGSWLRQLFG
jgi:heat shock protein HslJ